MKQLKEMFKKHNFNFNNFLAFWIITICFCYFFWISGSRHDMAQYNNVGEIKTAMIATIAAIVSYYFGSSRNASIKDDQINRMIDNNQEKKDGQKVGENEQL